jgi:PilZ domain
MLLRFVKQPGAIAHLDRTRLRSGDLNSMQTESRIAMIERRALARHRTFIKGRIYFNNQLSSVDCIVRDINDRGARLEASENVALPSTFELHLPNKDEHFYAQVEWRRGNLVGVSWCDEQASKQRIESGSHSDYAMADRVAKLERELAALQRRFDSLQQR